MITRHRVNTLRHGAVILLVASAFASCSDHTSAPIAADRVASITMSPSKDSLLVDESLQFVAEGRSATGGVVSVPLNWASSDPAVATVSSSGMVQARDEGTTVISATTGGITSVALLRVRERVAQAWFDSTAVTVRTSDTVYLKLNLRDRHGTLLNRPVSWRVLDAAIAGAENGFLHGHASGHTAVIGSVESRADTMAVTIVESATRIVIDSAPATLELRDTAQMRARVLDRNDAAVDSPILWTSSAPEVLSVDSTGLLTGRALGTATITAHVERVTASASIEVRAKVTGLTITTEASQLLVHPGQTFHLTAEFSTVTLNSLPRLAGTAGPVIEYTTSDPGVVSVASNGDLTAVSPGNATITASYGGYRDSAVVNVHVTKSVRILPESYRMEPWVDAALRAVAYDGSGREIPGHVAVWTSSNPSAASVAAGVVHAKTVGTTRISATIDSITTSAPVEVDWVPMATMKMAPATDSLVVGESVQLTSTLSNGTVLPANGLPLSFATSDNNIASVSATGMVTGVSAGTVKITGRAGGMQASTTIEVFPVPATVEVLPDNFQLSGGGTVTLTATPRSASGAALGGHVTWTTSSNTNATVDPMGKVTAMHEGTVTVTATIGGVSGTSRGTISGGSGGGGEGGGGGEEGGGGGEGGSGGESGLGNNLSWPVVFAEGIGLTGSAVSQDPGFPRVMEGDNTSSGRTFFRGANQRDCSLNSTQYFCQGGTSLWQADWQDGSGSAARQVDIKWGDNLTHHTYNTHANVHVEIELGSVTGETLEGFNMTTISGSGPTTVTGTDGSVGAFMPTVYTESAHLLVEKLNDSDTTAAPILALADAGVWQRDAFSAEVNVAGKVVYGYNLRVQALATEIFGGTHKFGWWRFTFIVGGGGSPVTPNVSIRQAVVPVAESDGESLKYVPNATGGTRSAISIYIEKGGSGGMGEH